MHSKSRLKLVHSAALRPEDWLRFVHIPPFPGQWARLKLAEADLQALEIEIIVDPQAGTVIPGAGGLRKIRFSPPGSHKGKSGSHRVFYVYLQDYQTVLLWAVIAKGEREDLPVADRHAIAKQIARINDLLDKGLIR
jgi:hypothetical protein